MSRLFISHSSKDDDFVRELQQALGDLNQDVWTDSRELRGGDPLWTEIQKAIGEASAYAVVVSTDALQSKWVGKELRHAFDVQKARGRNKFPVIPLSLNETKLGVLEEYFGEEPVYIPVSSDAGGVEAALNAILVAVGKRLPADVSPIPRPKAEPLEELVHGGENHFSDGRICLAVTQSLLAGDPAAAPPPATRRRSRCCLAPRLHQGSPGHRRRQPRPHPRRPPGIELFNGRQNPFPDRNSGKAPLAQPLNPVASLFGKSDEPRSTVFLQEGTYTR